MKFEYWLDEKRLLRIDEKYVKCPITKSDCIFHCAHFEFIKEDNKNNINSPSVRLWCTNSTSRIIELTKK